MGSSAAWKKAAVAVIVLAAVFFATYKLTEAPSVWYDEGFYIQSAANLAQHGMTGLELAPQTIAPSSRFITVGYPLIYPLALWFELFGVGVLQARSLMAIFIMGFLAAAYLAARKIWGPAAGLGALALLATLPTLYGNGKSVLGEVPGLLSVALSLYFLHLASAPAALPGATAPSISRKRLSLIAAALFASLAVATKPLFIVLIPAIAFAALMEMKHKALGAKELALMALAGAAPIALWLFLQFRGSDSVSQVLAYYANPYGIVDLWAVIRSNAAHLFTDLSTLYLTVTMIVWAGAVAIRFKRGEKIGAAEKTAFLFCLLVIAAFLRTAGWYRYLFPAQALSLIFLPGILYYLAGHAASEPLKRAVPWIVGILAVAGAYQTMFHSWVADGYASDKTAFWEAHMKGNAASTTYFFYNAPEVAIFAPTGSSYQFIEPAGGHIGEQELAALVAGTPDEAIIQADEYQSLQSGQGLGAAVFAKYAPLQQAYKYQILRRR